MSTADQTRETRLRRMADRQGLALQKARRRDPRAIDFDRWMIVNPFTNTIVAGTEVAGRPSLKVDEVEA